MVYTGGYRVAHWFQSLVSILMVIVLISVIVGAFRSVGTSSGITASTVDREPLGKQYVTDTGEYIDDSIGWIRSRSKVEKGLRYFYDKTGVMPYLVVTEQVDGTYHPTGQQVWDYGDTVYDREFSDEGHLVFVLQCRDETTDYTMAGVTGTMAKTVIDEEALEILYDYMDHNFYSDKSEDEMFADTFRDAADRIMSREGEPMAKAVKILGGGAIILAGLVVVYLILKAILKRQREKAEETQRLLETPVEKIGSTDEADELSKKYE